MNASGFGATVRSLEVGDERDSNQYLNARREIGDEAVWSLSSAKPGFGVRQLRDGNINTYWQSDGPQPHLVNIQFDRKVSVESIQIYSDFKLDESYTPSSISIRFGTCAADLRELKQFSVMEAEGWVTFPILKSYDESAASDGSPPCLRTNFVQIAILHNHQNGRDTHVRQVRIWGPRSQPVSMQYPLCSTTQFTQFQTIK